jgi:hypothetical protein
MVIVIVVDLIPHDPNLVSQLSDIVVAQTVCTGDVQPPPSIARQDAG